MIDKYSLSFVLPVYNEAEIIEKMIRDYHLKIISKFKNHEIIIINDCSTDETPQILNKLQNELDLKVINFPLNCGHGKALRTGLEFASGDLIFHTDSDYQHDPEDFWRLYQYIEDNDVD